MKTIVFDLRKKTKKLNDVLLHIVGSQCCEISSVKRDGSVVVRVKSTQHTTAKDAFERICSCIGDIPHAVTFDDDSEAFRFHVDLTTDTLEE